jgi:site-specific recombinase XerD
MAKNSNLDLNEAIAEFERHLARRPLSDNTRKAFLGDVRIFARYMQPEAPESAAVAPAPAPVAAAVAATRRGGPVALSTITGEDIKSFLAWQERSRVASSPKSIERRLTSLKVFFAWLRDATHLVVDPADGVAYKPFLDPLPEHLTEAQAEAVIKAAKHVATGERLEMRPLTAIMLVLETGIKKGECLALLLDDIERDDEDGPAIYIRYDKPRLQFKERRLAISQECLAVIDAHVQRYETRDTLFDCTGRNLEYIFNRKVAPLAGLESLTFEMLRWTRALRDYAAGELNDEQMQVKYGLSPIGWTEMEAKLARLTRPNIDLVPDDDE